MPEPSPLVGAVATTTGATATPGGLGAALRASALAAPPVQNPGLPPLPDLELDPGPATAPPAAPEGLLAATWLCAECAMATSYAEEACPNCGTSMFASLTDSRVELKDVPEAKVLAASAIPGGGFFALGLNGAAAARLMLTGWVIATALVLPGRLMSVKVMYLLAGAGLWAVSAWDALAASRRQSDAIILKPRVLLATVGALLLVLVGSMLFSTPRLGGDRDGGPSGPSDSRLIIEQPRVSRVDGGSRFVPNEPAD